ncbi:hypothetical protein FHG64_06740 [Antarcticibacterium flavum]|uniref:Prolyl-tRNA synthetase n=1 Tax=Antarcticibacterium flavum TaxID=2058175 RepID=A0A5B7X0S9_9FLAO|nr:MULTISPECIES: hypothetical protein [Antarcticibacterium]MCM4161523.1 hypothetical protein [Antarcticibacterium sp. W02-3]QCY69126.1 hypothetical protein FHG64_06740 [Antarcticibacterium flavum]
MALFKTTRRKLLLFLAPVSFLLLASCSSYQYTGNQDGIYGESNRTNQRGYDRQQNATQDNSGSSYYKNLFAEEAALYGNVLADDMIFTDVESYTSQGQYEEGAQSQGYRPNAPWGEDPDSYAVNIYNTGFYGGWGMGMWDPFWGGAMYGFDPFWGPGFWGPGHWGPGFWGPRWGGFYGSGWGFGMGRGFWGPGWSMGFGMWGAHPFFHGGGWYNPYNYYGNRYNSFRQNVAYNTGRRDAASYYQNRNRSGSSIRNAAAIDSRGRATSYSRSIRNLRGSNDNYGLTRRAVSREYTRSNQNYNTSNRSRVFDARSNRSNNTYSRPAQTRSNTVRSAPTSTRSSGSVRSSGGGRSSSGGTSSRGRGN